jgi:hypothetical protein
VSSEKKFQFLKIIFQQSFINEQRRNTMLKKVLKGMVIGAGVMVLAATAAPAVQANQETNMYGASAEFKVFVDIADDMCRSKGYTQNVQQYVDASGKYGITECTNPTTSDKWTIRYTAKASYDGIYSCYGETNVPGGQPSCKTGDTTPAGTKGPRYRAMLQSIATGDTLHCYEVNIGASDVGGAEFGQSSSGKLCGPFPCKAGDTCPTISRSVPAVTHQFVEDTNGIPAVGEHLLGASVPFGFFVNDAALPDIQNITRPMAGIIFSGNVTNWADFDNYGDPTPPGTCTSDACDNLPYPNKFVIASLRHAGSGTLATFVHTVMMTPRGGYTLAATEADPVLWFNDGSSDMMNTIRYNAGMPTSDFGAIGIADCDQCGDSGLCAPANPPATKTLCPNHSMGAATVTDTGARLISYNGAQCAAWNIQNGVYQYWSPQNIYYCSGGSLTANMISYSLGSIPASKACFWVPAKDSTVSANNGMRVEHNGHTLDGDIYPQAGTSNWGTGMPGQN